MKTFAPESVSDDLMQALNETLDNKSKILDADNKKFVRKVLEWAEEKDYLAIFNSSYYMLNELSRVFMASRVLYFWKKLNHAWRNKVTEIKNNRKLMSAHNQKLEEVRKRLSSGSKTDLN